MDVQGSSVLIAMEDGWDTLPQLSSLAQVLLDPYYRLNDYSFIQIYFTAYVLLL